MIQLASDPNASRMNWRPAQADKDTVPGQRGRTAHAWPFISRYAEKPVAPEQDKKAATEHGS